MRRYIRILAPRERKVLLALIDSGGLNSYELAFHCMMSHRATRRMVETLLRDGIIERSGSSIRARYLVTPHALELLKEAEDV